MSSKKFLTFVANKKNLTKEQFLFLNMFVSVHAFRFGIAPLPPNEMIDPVLRIMGWKFPRFVREYFDTVLEELPAREIQKIFSERFGQYLNLKADQSDVKLLVAQKLIKPNKRKYRRNPPGISAYILGLETENERFFLKTKIGRNIWKLWNELELKYFDPTNAGIKITSNPGKDMMLSSKPTWIKNGKNNLPLPLAKDVEGYHAN